MASIDLDRGVMIRKAQGPNMKIFMYIDEPGVYYNVHGGEVPKDLAKLAGYDVEKYAKLKWKRDRMSEFQAQIERELEIENSEEPAKIIASEKGFEVRAHGGLGAVDVFDPDGGKLNDRPITEAEGLLLLKFMAGEQPAPKNKGKAKDGKPAAEAAPVPEATA